MQNYVRALDTWYWWALYERISRAAEETDKQYALPEYPCPAPDVHAEMYNKWEYQDDEGNWHTYSKEVCQVIEEAHEDQVKKLRFDVPLGNEEKKTPVLIWIHGRMQINCETGDVTALRRRQPRLQYESIPL